jgi:hypothetical protein
MKRAILLAVFLALSFISALAQQPFVHPESGSWVMIAPANAGFTVLLPVKPSETTAPIEGMPNVQNHTLSVDTVLAGYVVSFVQFPDDVTDPGVIKEILDNGRDGGVASSKAELTSEKEIKLGGYFGREWAMKLPGGLSSTVRAYWVKRRLYQTIFVEAPKASDTPETNKLRKEAALKFLDSFALSADGK